MRTLKDTEIKVPQQKILRPEEGEVTPISSSNAMFSEMTAIQLCLHMDKTIVTEKENQCITFPTTSNSGCPLCFKFHLSPRAVNI